MLRVCSIKFFRVFDNTYYCCFYFSLCCCERKPFVQEPVTIFVVFCGLILILYLKRIARNERAVATTSRFSC